MVSPVWILWIMSAKFTACGGNSLSAGTVAFFRLPASFWLGLWHSTHCSIWLRFSPCTERRLWHWLQLLILTTVRRGCTGVPSTEKLKTTFLAPLVTL